MLLRLPLTIGGVDFSHAVDRTGYQFYLEERTGENGMLTLSGDEYPDIIARKPVIVWPLNALFVDELAALHAAIGTTQFVQVQYFDPSTNANETAQFRASISTQSLGFYDSRGMLYNGMVLTLRAR